MKKFIFIITLICFCGFASCNTSKSSDEDIAKVVDSKSYDILFDYDNIDSVFYCEDDDCVYVHYIDPDCFDLDNLAYLTGRDKWYGDYIRVDVEDTLICDFLYDYETWKAAKDYWQRDALNKQYVLIEEDLVYNDGNKDIIFYIQRAIKENEEE